MIIIKANYYNKKYTLYLYDEMKTKTKKIIKF